MDFVFMLTRNDATVENALELVASPVRWASSTSASRTSARTRRCCDASTAAIREAGASPWMEVVSTSRDDELRSIALGRDLGVDWLMGGVEVEGACAFSRGARSAICRSPASRSAIRRGSAARRRRSRRTAAPSRKKAARASTFSPIGRPRPSRSTSSPPAGAGLATRARSSSPVRSIRAERVAAVRAAGADAFTIGTAAIDLSYAPGAGPLEAQLRAVLKDCRAT